MQKNKKVAFVTSSSWSSSSSLLTHLSLSSSRPSTMVFLSLTISNSFSISCFSFCLSQAVFRCSAQADSFYSEVCTAPSWKHFSEGLTWFLHQSPEVLHHAGLLFLQVLSSSTELKKIKNQKYTHLFVRQQRVICKHLVFFFTFLYV